jgi:hypothetical protein
MSNKRKQDKRGRSKGSLGSFVALERYIMQSMAFRSLSPNARAAYLEVCFGYDGSNNGRIVLSSQMLAERLHRDKSTAARALSELEHLGFIACRSKGAFRRKMPHASEWRLTAHKCDVTGELPTKLFMQWKPENAKRGGTGELHGGTGATDSLKTTQNSPSQWHRRNREGQSSGVSGGTGATHLYSNHTPCNSHTASNAQADAARQGAGVKPSPLNPNQDDMQPIASLALQALSHLERLIPASQIIATPSAASPSRRAA